MSTHPFTDPISHREVTLHVTTAGAGVEHPGCTMLADIAVELDAFYCPECRWTGRISGAWFVDIWRRSRTDGCEPVQHAESRVTLLGCSRCGRLWSVPGTARRATPTILNEDPWRCPACVAAEQSDAPETS